MKLKNPESPFLAPRAVIVNNLAPGVINTDRSHGRLSDPTYVQIVLSWIPAGSIGQPSDCAGAALLPLRPERTVEGLAFTVKSAPNVKITGEMTFRTQMISELPADTMTGNFFQSTMPAMESAWLRPNTPEFHHIQNKLAAKLHAALTA
jgi:hypothetical protein